MSNSFTLKNANTFDIFKPTSQNGLKLDIVNINVKNLVHYNEHPFKLYKGERFNDMVESIKSNGIFTPLIVRPIDEFNYEILSGHNRLEAAKVAGLETVPCLVKENLTEEEALIIVTETNLIQRSFADLSHSERASSLAIHYEAIKKQGKRNNLIAEIEKLLLTADKADNDKENLTSPQVGAKLRTDEMIAEKYGLSKNSIARYIRLNKLIKDFKDLMDKGELSFGAGYFLSYIKDAEQEIIYDYTQKNELKIDIKKAEKLKQLSLKESLTEEKISEIFIGKKNNKIPKPKKIIKLNRKKLTNYFNNDEPEENIEKTILEALEFYFENKDEFSEGEIL